MKMHGVSPRTAALLLLLSFFLADYADGRALQAQSQPSTRSLLSSAQFGFARKLAFLVEEPPLILEYHNGPLLSATPKIPVYIVCWWKVTHGYKDAAGSAVRGTLELKAEVSNDYTKGKSLVNSDLEALVLDSLTTFPKDPHGIYLVFTGEDVSVEGFCMNSCASHFATPPSDATSGLQLPYGWVGNSATQCPGMCAWPYAKAQYGPDTDPLVAPNGDIGMDGIIINLGTILAGMATNPFNNGFFQGDAAAPLEAASACGANYGEGAYAGYPGKLLVDVITGASYNVNGANDRKYLLSALWNPVTLKCTPPS